MVKDYLYTLTAASITLAAVFMVTFIQGGSFISYLKVAVPVLLIFTVFIFLIYLFSAVPLALILNKKESKYNIFDLFIYLLVAFLIFFLVDNTILSRILSMSLFDFINGLWRFFILWLASGFSYWFWNTFFIIQSKNKGNS